MSGVTELGYVRIAATDLNAWKLYLTELLGLELRDDMDDGRLWARIDSMHHRIIVEPGEQDDVIAMGLRVAGREEFRELQRDLEAAGVTFRVGSIDDAIERFVLEVMFLEDPVGNPIEIYHGLMFEPHMPFYPSRRRFGKFVTGDGGLGHLIIRDQDPEESYQFYRLLGLRAGSEFRVPTPAAPGGYVSGRFMNCVHPGAREHTIAFGMERRKLCNHLMMEVDNIDDVMSTYELIKASEYPIMLDVGRHSNDGCFSFYAQSPSGFLIEVAAGGEPAPKQSYLVNGDYWGHAPNPDFPAHMGEVDDQKK